MSAMDHQMGVLPTGKRGSKQAMHSVEKPEISTRRLLDKSVRITNLYFFATGLATVKPVVPELCFLVKSPRNQSLYANAQT